MGAYRNAPVREAHTTPDTTRPDALKAYQRAWQAKRRRARLDAQNASRLTCAALLSKGRPCRTALQSRFVDGVTVPFCPVCEAKARGTCVACLGATVAGTVGRALYCGPCRKLATHQASAKSREKHADRYRRRERARMADPVKHAAKLEYKKLYRQQRREKTRQYKASDYAKHRERYLEYHRQYRAARKAERAAVERARCHGALPPRTCLYCPTVLTGRPKVCEPCKVQQRKAARAAIAQRLAVAS